LVRPYVAFDGTLCDALQHTIPKIMLPSHNEDAAYPLPSVVFRMFDYSDIPDVSKKPSHNKLDLVDAFKCIGLNGPMIHSRFKR